MASYSSSGIIQVLQKARVPTLIWKDVICWILQNRHRCGSTSLIMCKLCRFKSVWDLWTSCTEPLYIFFSSRVVRVLVCFSCLGERCSCCSRRFVVRETSPNFSPARRWDGNDCIFTFGWTHPLICCKRSDTGSRAERSRWMCSYSFNITSMSTGRVGAQWTTGRTISRHRSLLNCFNAFLSPTLLSFAPRSRVVVAWPISPVSQWEPRSVRT